jgi:hypothetical protein
METKADEMVIRYSTAFAVMFNEIPGVKDYELSYTKAGVAVVEFKSLGGTPVYLVEQSKAAIKDGKPTWCALMAQRGWKIAWGQKDGLGKCEGCMGTGNAPYPYRGRCIRCHGTGKQRKYTGVCCFLLGQDIRVSDNWELWNHREKPAGK